MPRYPHVVETYEDANMGIVVECVAIADDVPLVVVVGTMSRPTFEWFTRIGTFACSNDDHNGREVQVGQHVL